MVRQSGRLESGNEAEIYKNKEQFIFPSCFMAMKFTSTKPKWSPGSFCESLGGIKLTLPSGCVHDWPPSLYQEIDLFFVCFFP